MDEKQIAAVRSFNRFYTSVIGLLDKHYLNSEFSLTEARILYELHHQPNGVTASDLIAQLQLDKGYLSRILQQFEKRGLVRRQISAIDKRSSTLSLTDSGKTVFGKLNQASVEQLTELLSSRSNEQLNQLVYHMNQIQQILENTDTH